MQVSVEIYNSDSEELFLVTYLVGSKKFLQCKIIVFWLKIQFFLKPFHN